MSPQALGEEERTDKVLVSLRAQGDGFCFLSLFLKLFLEGESTHACTRAGEGQREREDLKQAPHSGGAQHEARSHAPEIMSWAEIKSRTLNPLSHPGAPFFSSFR